MKILLRRCILIALLSPLACAAAPSAQSELAAVLKAKPDPVHGAQLFAQCVACHQADGGGETSGSTPRIAGQHFRVVTKQLVDFRYGKRWDFRMEGMADKHHLANAQDIADVSAHVSQLAQPGRRGIGSGEFAEEGARIYAKQCQSCHGAEGQGNDAKAIPRLAGQHYSYLVRQMYDAVDGRRPALPKLHSQRIAPLDFEQVRAVSDFLARIGWNGVAAPEATDTHPTP